jgi:peptide deformylase
MSVRPVRIWGDPVLRQRAKPVTAFDEPLRELVADLFDTMKVYDGCGLAAPQVGVSQRLFVVGYDDDEGQPLRLVVVNPELSDRKGKDSMEEGCLSIPHLRGSVERPTRVVLRAQDEHGQAYEVVAEGFLARVLQHEYDHLEGVMFPDRMSPLRRQFLRRDLDALARGEVPEGYHPGEPDPSGGRSI